MKIKKYYIPVLIIFIVLISIWSLYLNFTLIDKIEKYRVLLDGLEKQFAMCLPRF